MKCDSRGNNRGPQQLCKKCSANFSTKALICLNPTLDSAQVGLERDCEALTVFDGDGIDLEHSHMRYTTLVVTTSTAVCIASSKSPVMNAATCRTKA